MQTYPFLNSVSNIEPFFNVIRTDKVPPKFTYRHLSEIGFSSSNDRNYIPLLKFLSFLTPRGLPTNKYYLFKNEDNYKSVLRDAIYDSYSKIFNQDKNVPNMSEEDLIKVFSKFSNASINIHQKQATTFMQLCIYADFDSPTEPVIKNSNNNSLKDLKLNINIPATTDERVYQVLFKHLKDLLTYQDQ